MRLVVLLRVVTAFAACAVAETTSTEPNKRFVFGCNDEPGTPYAWLWPDS